MPLWILVVAAIANPFITLAVFTVVIVLFLTAVGQAPSLAAIGLFTLYCLALTLIVVGFSLATSVLFLKYRDLNQVWDMVTQAGFFLAPIIYPLGIVPERFHFYLLCLAADADHRVLPHGARRRAHADAYWRTSVC